MNSSLFQIMYFLVPLSTLGNTMDLLLQNHNFDILEVLQALSKKDPFLYGPLHIWASECVARKGAAGSLLIVDSNFVDRNIVEWHAFAICGGRNLPEFNGWGKGGKWNRLAIRATFITSVVILDDEFSSRLAERGRSNVTEVLGYFFTTRQVFQCSWAVCYRGSNDWHPDLITLRDSDATELSYMEFNVLPFYRKE